MGRPPRAPSAWTRAQGTSPRRAASPPPTHDAAATVVDGQVLVFGGGTSAPAAATQDITPSGSSRILGSLPRPRADGDAVTIGGTAYVVGGYDGPSLDPAVLATADGATFRTVTDLSVPVRYPAVAALGGLIYVFGGESLGGLPVAPYRWSIRVTAPTK